MKSSAATYCRISTRASELVMINVAHTCKSAANNMQSASSHPEIINAYIREEVAAGRITGPGCASQPFRCDTKASSRITDLLAPLSTSVNNGTYRECCYLTYVSVDEAVESIWHLWRGALLAKVDIASAYLVVPVHPDDHRLLGMVWKGDLYMDGVLPFSLRSVPKFFNELADCLLWCMGKHGVA